ncbi:hypothetical protein N7449_012291 [Penicillium cf. viridicatum]|uniref:Uncharacterized protein n=1 Tax=Penicillium cf. viridicatum TaxID=2972119 RepID=A0A9W9INA6_9EURO|nr:hypothetical protein N7449_012291 [Penicillium cf. viridicatum]
MREREALTLPLSTAPDPTNQTATPEQAPTVMHNAQELSVISNTRSQVKNLGIETAGSRGTFLPEGALKVGEGSPASWAVTRHE